jgi:hypothetical protein
VHFCNRCTEAPGGARGLTAGEGLPVPANKRAGAAGELTWRRLGAVVASGRAPASSGGEAEAVRPARPEIRRGAAECGAIKGGGGTKES